jgi:diguanylate cyclase (GGDEF)-like protein
MPGDGQDDRCFRTRTARVVTHDMIASSRRRADVECWVVIYAAVPGQLCRLFPLDPARVHHVVGRSSQCDIVIDSSAASRKHARIERLPDGWCLVDLGSLNGTYVNDVRITAHLLAHGDRIQVGDTIFKHLSDDVESAYLKATRAAMVTDGLTQASNDRAFRDELEAAVTRAVNAPSLLSLVLADLDRFKSINDRFGHPAGDRVLREFVRVLRAAVPADATVGRVGGEEFGVILPGRALAAAREIAERARAAVAAHPFATPAGTLAVTASFGIAALGAVPESATGFFERADEMLYAAKRAGRNRVSG